MNDQNNLLKDQRIRLLNLLLEKHEIPDSGEFNLRDLVKSIPEKEYRQLFAGSSVAEPEWQGADIADSLSAFLIENGLARQVGNNLQLTMSRGQYLKKQGSYNKLLEDERYVANEARRVSELEIEADRTAHRQYKINLVIALGTTVAAIYYLLEILNGFFGFYTYHH